MHYKVHFHVLLLCVFFMLVFTTIDALPCDSCGNECASACGTKQFRTCCFNYLRKRKRNNNNNNNIDNDPNSIKFISNKRLIDIIMLQGHAMFTLNELMSREQEEQRQQRWKEAAAARRNGTNMNVGLQTYYG